MTAALRWLRGLLAVGLLAGVYVLAFVLVAVDTVLVAGVPWSAFASIPAVFALLYGVATVSRVEQQPPGAVAVCRREAPGLWRLVEDLAEQMRTRPPSRIYLTPEVNASVSEEVRMLGFLVGERTMYIGAPLLAWLKPGQLRAVLCHELGHYAGRHTRFGAITHRGAASLRSTLFRLRMTAQSGQSFNGYAWFFQAAIGVYAWVYLRLSLAVRRRQELEADAEAVAAVGPAVTADALRAVHALGTAWAGFMDTYVCPVQRLGFVPEDLFEAFATMVDDPFFQERLAELREHPVEANRSRLDSHPPLAKRLKRIEARPAGEPRAIVDYGPLLADRSPMLRVQGEILAESWCPATALPWAKWADLAAEAFAVEPVRQLLHAASGAEATARPTVRTVLELLEQGEQGELAGRLPDAPEPEQQLAEALYALVGQALAGAGLARWVFSWTRGYLLVCHDETGRDLEELAAAAARDGSAVDDLRDELALLGLNVDAPVPLALRTVSVPAERTTDVRITNRVPGFVAKEVERQRRVRMFTMAAMLIIVVLSVILAITSDESDRHSSVDTTPHRTAWPTYGLTYGTPSASTPSYYPLPSIAVPVISPSRLSPFPDITYDLVKPGDTLTKTACRHHTTVGFLRILNNMDSSTDIKAGDLLKVPTLGSGVVVAGCR